MTPAYDAILTAAVADIAAHGYDTEERIAYWQDQLRIAAASSLRSVADIERATAESMAALYRKLVDQGAVLRTHPGVSRYTLEQIRPQLHGELTRRIRANAELIKSNRAEAIEKTVRRFSAWATSVPPGGSETIDKRDQKADIRRSLTKLSFEDRRVTIDQTAKLNAAISATVALNGNAIGAVWHSHKHQAGYDGRPAHNARDGKFFLVKDSWAHERGLLKPGPDGYITDVEQPAFLPFCRCSWGWVYSLRSVPADCITAKGREALAAARTAIRNAG